MTEINEVYATLKKCKNNTSFQVILYVIFMTTFFLLYYSHENEEFEKSTYLQHYNEAIISPPQNTSEKCTSIFHLKKGYVVWSDSCQIPNISAYDKSINHLMKKKHPAPKCSSNSPLTSVVLDADSWSYSFKINHAVISKTNKQNVKCCYSSIFRNRLKYKKSFGDDDRYNVEQKCHPINDSEIIPKSIEYMMVTCKTILANTSKSKSTVVYKDTHAMVIDKGQRRFRNINMPKNPSVLIISIDSLSRLNLIRSMPITYRLLKAHGFMSLDGYTKIADNTFPNVVPILTGMFEKQMVKRCWKNPSDKMDDCPFLWNDFKQRGYVTAYVEDEPSMGTYNYGKYGFLNAPTDYYSRPYMLATESLLPVVRFDGMNYCLGPRSAPDRIYGYVEDFVRLHRHHGYFAIFWLNTFSHNDLNTPSSMDQRTADTLSRLLDNRLLDNAVAVLLSDHGLRFGEIRKTRVGWLEERMPAFYARLPPGYAAALTGHHAALAANRYRLTSPFDLHLTLKHLLSTRDAAEDGAAALQRADGCPTCRSLFRLADANRSCEQAGIVSHWCTCQEYEELDGSVGVAAVDCGAYAVRQLNELLVKYRKMVHAGYVCSTLSLKKTVSVRYRVNQRTGDREFLAIVETLPGHSLFEVTFDQRRDDGKFGALGDISRINMYGFQSHCTNDWKLKKHCYCVKDKQKSGS